MTDGPITPIKYEDAPHGDDCQCPRCTGFQPGNRYAVVKHGAYSRVLLAERAAEHADWLREIIPVGSPGAEPAVAGLALILSRLEASSRALEALDGDHPLQPYVNEIGERLRADTARWLRLLLSYAEALSLTPAAMARLGLDIADAQRAQREAMDLSRLSTEEVRDLRGLVAKATGEEEVGE